MLLSEKLNKIENSIGHFWSKSPEFLSKIVLQFLTYYCCYKYVMYMSNQHSSIKSLYEQQCATKHYVTDVASYMHNLWSFINLNLQNLSKSLNWIELRKSKKEKMKHFWSIFISIAWISLIALQFHLTTSASISIKFFVCIMSHFNSIK